MILLYKWIRKQEENCWWAGINVNVSDRIRLLKIKYLFSMINFLAKIPNFANKFKCIPIY